MAKSPSIQVVILNWNGLKDTDACLGSLLGLSYPNYRITVVDNHSTDGSALYLKRNYPQIRLIENEENLGFAEGNNVGITDALARGSDYIILLNNDTTVKPDFISGMIEVAKSDSQIGIVGPKILFYDSKTIWYAGGMLNRRTGFTYHLGEGQEDIGQFNQIREVDFVSGCAMLIKKRVFESVVGLDEDYYHSHEDADFCLRAKAKGYKVVYAPQAVIYHKLARSSGGKRSPFYLYYRTRNHLIFKHKLAIKAPWFWPIYVSLVMKRIFGSLAIGQPKGAWATTMGIYDYFAHNWGKGNGDKFR